MKKSTLTILAALCAGATFATDYHWRGAAPGTSFATEDEGLPTHACGQWATVSNWTDANGNTMTDYPHQNGDVAIFHGTVNGGYVHILAQNVIDISEIRFVEGHTILAVDPVAHFSATRMTFMNHATFGYVATNFEAFTPPNDFVIGNRDDLLVKDGSGNYGLLLGGACYQNWSSGNFANNNTVSLDADGKLVTHVGTENMSIDLWGNDTYSDLGGVIFGQWGDFRGVNYNNDATWTYTVKASSFMHINNYGHIGKAGDKAQGTVDTTGTDCYVWSRAQPAERCTVYVRSKIVNAPTLVVAGFGYTVLFDNHESETCDYCITTGDLRLGGDICKGSTSTIESWTCKLGSGDISVGWYGKLDVASANALNADSTINVSSYNKKGGVFGKINLANNATVNKLVIDGVEQDAGTYGAEGSGATNVNADIFTGSGVLTVTNGTYVPPVDPPVTEKKPLVIYFN